jgi:hypothetical protein
MEELRQLDGKYRFINCDYALLRTFMHLDRATLCRIALTCQYLSSKALDTL